MHPILFYLGDHPFYTYGTVYGAVLFMGTVLALRRAEREGIDGAFYLRTLLVALIGMFFMAKFLHVVTNMDWYARKWSRLYDMSVGHVFYGGYIGAIVFPYFYVRWSKKPFLPVLDVTSLYMPLGLAAHRAFACLNAGCCHGRPTDLPWGIVFPAAAPASKVYGAIPVHPTQLYEATFALFLYFFLLFYDRRYRRVPGEIIALQVACYSVGRFTIEFFRGDTDRGQYGPFSTSQWISIALLGAASVLWIYLRSQRRKRLAAV